MGGQNLGFMEIFEEKLNLGVKKRTNRIRTKFREKLNVGDIAHIFIRLRTPDAKKLFDAKIKNKIYWNIINAPICNDNEAKEIESPKLGESWYDFATNDGFGTYFDFLDFFQSHPKNTKKKKFKDFICFEFEKINYKKLTEFIEV